MKKGLSIVLSFIMIVSLFIVSVPVSAQDAVKLVVWESTGGPMNGLKLPERHSPN
jgi:hypothetical protein